MTRFKNHLVILVLVAIPFIARFQMFTGLRQQTPLMVYAVMQNLDGCMGPGQPTVESNMGFTAQALGTRAANDWFEGRVPLWNSFEGTGVPLAGEMQSAALFLPFILLLKSLSGQLYFHTVLQIIAGVCTFLYLRKIRLGVAASFCGAALFELNGTFAWIGNAAYNPIAFLPMSLLGLELAIGAAQRGARCGWLVLCAGAVWSVYAGFPEVALLNALLVAVYLLFRASQLPRAILKPLAFKLGLCLVVTLLLIGPLIAQFTDFLSFAYIGGRGDSGSRALDPKNSVIVLLAPYIYGPIENLFISYWSLAAGYLGFAPVVLAIAGAGWRWRSRVVQCFALWAVVCLLKIHGEPLTTWLLLKIPGLKLVMLVRWLMPSLEFSLAVLAAAAVDELFSRSRASLWIPAFIATGTVAVSLCVARVSGAFGMPGYFIFGYAALNLLWIVLFAMACCFAPQLGKASPWVISSLAVLEALLLFTVPIFSAPTNCRIDTNAVEFLRKNIGLQRFYTLGPILPNYGSAFVIAELNYDDMPVSKYIVDYFRTHLDPFMDPFNTKPNWERGSNPLNNEVIRDNWPAYGRAGVKYIVALPAENLSDYMHLVYHSNEMKIYELFEHTPYFTGNECELTPVSRDEVEVRCQKPATIVRLESFTPNWKATINGQSAAIRMHDGLFQSVDVPAGVSTVKFTYRCPHGVWVMPLFWLGALGFAVAGASELWLKPGVTPTTPTTSASPNEASCP